MFKKQLSTSQKENVKEPKFLVLSSETEFSIAILYSGKQGITDVKINKSCQKTTMLAGRQPSLTSSQC